MSSDLSVLKYFYEEPALLEPVTPDADPDARRREERSELPEAAGSSSASSIPLEELLDTRDAYRGYLAGTNRSDDTVGLTTLPAAAYVPALLEAFGESWWGRCTTEKRVEPLDDAAQWLQAPEDTAVLVTADTPIPAERIAAVAGRARRRALSALRSLLDTAGIVFFPEPAHNGHDWSVFSASPMRDRFVDALQRHPTEAVRRFVLPYQRARSESKFYFETWQLTESPLPDYIEEV